MTKLNLKFGPPPSTRFEATPTAKEVQFFHENGFLAVERMTSDEEIAWMRRIFEFIFSKENASGPARRSTVPARWCPAKARLTQAFFPEIYFPELLTPTTAATPSDTRRRCSASMNSTLSSWGHMIQKTAGRPGRLLASGPRLLAARARLLRTRRLAADARRHRRDGRDAVHPGLAQARPGAASPGRRAPAQRADGEGTGRRRKAVACPLKMGGATFHHSETLHYTAPNATGTPRLAFPMEFQLAPVRRSKPVSMPWMEEFRESHRRRQQDLSRSGRPHLGNLTRRAAWRARSFASRSTSTRFRTGLPKIDYAYADLARRVRCGRGGAPGQAAFSPALHRHDVVRAGPHHRYLSGRLPGIRGRGARDCASWLRSRGAAAAFAR